MLIILRDTDYVISSRFGDTNGINEFATDVQVKVQIVGEHDAIERNLIPIELLLVRLAAVQVSIVYILSFKESHRHALFCNNIVRRTAFLAARLVCYDVTGQKLRKERLKGAAEAMLRGVTDAVQSVKFLDVVLEVHRRFTVIHLQM